MKGGLLCIFQSILKSQILMKFGISSKKLFWNNRHNKKEKPIATHLPFELTKQGDDYFITGHMAYGNPQWRTFETCEAFL